MNKIEGKRISFIGGGNITEVFITRLVGEKFTLSNNIIVSDLNEDRLKYLNEKFKTLVTKDNREAFSFGDFVFLAVPPPQVKIVLTENASYLRQEQVLISLAAALPLRVIENTLNMKVPVVRVIPNTPSQVGRGVNPFCFGTYVTEEQRKATLEMLNFFGDAIEIDESQINLATALTAVGPTYLFPAIKSLIDFAIKHGLDKELAFRLVNDTVAGTAELIKTTKKDPDVLKLQIGTRTINENEVARLFLDAVETAFNKILLSEKKLTE